MSSNSKLLGKLPGQLTEYVKKIYVTKIHYAHLQDILHHNENFFLLKYSQIVLCAMGCYESSSYF